MEAESVASDIEHDAPVGSPAVCPEGSESEEGAQKPQAPTLTRSTKYYLSLVTFRVGNKLFRVPREGFMNRSQVFCDMFNISSSNDKGQEGESDENPIHLEQIDEGAFEDLLQLLYPDRPNGGLLLRVSGDSATDRWLNVLDLAHMWQFKDIRDHCIEKLEEYGLDVIRTIVVAHRYEITQWYVDAYVELAKRKEPLTFDESQHFTKDFMVKLARVRELEVARRARMGADSTDEKLEEDVQRIFFGINPVPQFTRADVNSPGLFGSGFGATTVFGHVPAPPPPPPPTTSISSTFAHSMFSRPASGKKGKGRK